ncbi:hypothetical protein AHAS_Ahas19G0153700 [Arachis hypogaea]|uniref:Uncharacterized protein n=1 Tax=Arachis hypogaea TaxID=3818 RepID=A0A444XKU5_ARAHY|nr:hypothetical protein Ahy_B09g096464 isoform B [Arachis hypogaea]
MSLLASLPRLCPPSLVLCCPLHDDALPFLEQAVRRLPSLSCSWLLSLEKSRYGFDPFVCRVPSRKKRRRMEGAKRLQGNSLSLFSEGIGFVLLRWSTLRDAVENQWGGPDSRLKADNLATDILSWFTQSREPLDIDDLEVKLDDGMFSLNVRG